MKRLLRNFSGGLIILLVSFSVVSPALAQNNNKDRKENQVKINANANLRALSQYTLATGELTAKNGNSLTVKLNKSIPRGNRGDQYHRNDTVTVALAAETIFSRNDFSKGTAAELTVGDAVQVFGRLDARGTLHALSVKDTSLQLTTQALVGTVSALDPQARTITLVHRTGFSHKWLPLTVYVNDKTQLRDQNRNPITFAQIQLNQEARVDGVLNTRNNTVVATRLKATVTTPEPLPFSMKGAVTAISSAELPAQVTLRVSDILPPLEARTRAIANNSVDLVTFTITANTKLTTESGAAISYKDISVGDTLIVQANINSAGAITATMVQSATVQTAVWAEGTLGSLNAAAKTAVLTKADGSTVNVQVNGSSTLSIPGINQPAFTDLKAGFAVKVQGTLNTRTNVLTASSLTVTDMPQPLPFSLKGTLTAISGTNFPVRLTIKVTDVLPPLPMGARAMTTVPVDEFTFTVTVNTQLRNNTGGSMQLSNLAVGDTITVQGNINNSGEMTATIVQEHSANTSPTSTASAKQQTLKSQYAAAFWSKASVWR